MAQALINTAIEQIQGVYPECPSETIDGLRARMGAMSQSPLTADGSLRLGTSDGLLWSVSGLWDRRLDIGVDKAKIERIVSILEGWLEDAQYCAEPPRAGKREWWERGERHRAKGLR